MNLGTVVVGKTRRNQFASGEQLTADWIEYSFLWNPRGDWYLNPSGSSTRSGVAVIFTNQPPYELLNLEGMIRCPR